MHMILYALNLSQILNISSTLAWGDWGQGGLET